MDSLETELSHARDLSVSELADAIERIGFECTDCGACCKAAECGEASATDESQTDSETSGDESGRETATEDHTATVFPDEVRELQARDSYDWRDVARPMPYGLEDDGQSGETFEWALQTDACGDCVFYEPGDAGSENKNGNENEGGRCGVYGDRPLICQTYPFSVALDAASASTDAPDETETAGPATAGVVETVGPVNAHECEGLGRDISRAEATDLARTLKRRTIRELEEAIGVRDSYQPTDADTVVVHDSEGQKRPDGTPL